MHPAPTLPDPTATAPCASFIGAALASFTAQTGNQAGGPEYTSYPRFAPRREIYVLHREFGRLAEISMGGIRFTYFDQAFFSAEPPAMGMLFTNTDDYLDEIPFQVVSDKLVSPLFASRYFLKERRIRFGELSANQVNTLERFILKNAHIPQLSFDARYADYKSIHPAAL